MSHAVSQCVYSQIQRYSLSRQAPRDYVEQMVIFVVTRVFDAAFATAAAVAAAAAGARAAGVPLTSEILQHAAVAGALKSATMTFTGLVMLVPQNPALIVLMALLGTSIASNVVVVAALAQRILGSAPTELLVAAVVASIPLSFCCIYYYGAFRVPITLTSIAFDVLGAYTFVKMAENQGHPICPPRPALVAGAVFGSLFSFSTTLLGCCAIGQGRTIYIHQYSRNGSVNGTATTSWCGNRVYVSIHSTEYATGPGVQGQSSMIRTGTVYNSAHGLGICWNPGAVGGSFGVFGASSRDWTTAHGSSSMVRYSSVAGLAP